MGTKTTLKEVYRDLFRVGTAVESIHDRFTNNEIGNPAKEELIVREFSSMTCANELKPAYNMGWNTGRDRFGDVHQLDHSRGRTARRTAFAQPGRV